MEHSESINYKELLDNKKLQKLLLKGSKLKPEELAVLIKENNEDEIWPLLKTKTILEVSYSHDWGGSWGVYQLGCLFFCYVEYCGYDGPFMSYKEALPPEEYFDAGETTGTEFDIQSSLPLKTTLKMFKNLVHPGESLKINNKTYTRTRKGLTITK